MAWNQQDLKTAAHQWGGTALLTTGLSTSRIHSHGKDPRQLGRWCWTKYTGKSNLILNIYSIYRPVKNLRGPLSVYQQHRTHLSRTISPTADPLKTFDEDLINELQQCLARGEHLLIGGDINEEINHSTLVNSFLQLGLQEAILSHHAEDTPSLSTHIRNDRNRIIDGIWKTPGLVISGSGYTSFSTWDHRTAWIDLDTRSAFGTPQKHHPTRFSGRRLQLSNSASVRKYLGHLVSATEKLQLLARARTLNLSVRHTLTLPQQKELETIDRLRTAAMLEAERTCRKLRMGQVPYSPLLIQHALALSFWKLLLKQKHGGKVSSRLLKRKREQAALPPQPFSQLTVPQIQDHIQHHRLQWTQAKKEASKRRQEFLEQKALELTGPKTNQATALRRLLRAEQLRRHHRQIKYSLRPSTSSGLSSVYSLPDANGHRQHLTQPHLISQCCAQANEAKYRQTEHTPFMLPPLVHTVNYDGLTPSSQSILRGQFNDPSLSPHTKTHLTELAIPSGLPPWPSQFLEISKEEHAMSWRKAKEFTSSSPSGLHFGLWKANATHDHLCELDAIMRAIPFRTGYALKRWLQGTDVELQKEPNNWNIERLRTIVLIEADHNMNNKLLGRRTMSHGEVYHALAPEQHGSRKRLSAIQASVNNRLMYDLMRQHRHGGILCSNDAKSCYDRIVHSVLSLSLQRLGVPSGPIQSMLHTIQHMQHRIKSAYGVSDNSYSSVPSLPPLQGLIQGHGAAPTGWCATSTPIINAVRKAGFGFQHASAITRQHTTIACTAFVDDTDLWSSSLSPTDTPSESVQRAQHMLDLWNGLLHSTGGALVAKKSYWHYIDFEWTGRQWNYCSLPPDLPPLTVFNHTTGQREPLTLLSAHQGRRTLGVHLHPDGKDSTTVASLISKAQAWADRLRTNPLSASPCWLALNTTIMKTLEYPLPATTMSATDCNRIMWPALQAALPRCHIQRRFPRSLLNAPISAMGLGLPSLYLTQLQQHIMILLRHGHDDSITGRLIRATTETLRLELGTDHYPLDLPYHRWGHLATPTWLTFTWQGLSEQGLRVTDTTASPTSPRRNDIPIMDFLVTKIQDKSTLSVLNHCRLFLHLFWLSDLVSADGELLDPSLIKGKPSFSQSSLCNWPRQGPPTATAWSLWHRLLRTHVCQITRSPALRLQSPLGPFLLHWLHPAHHHSRWLSLWDPESDRIYIRPPSSDTSAQVWTKVLSRHRSQQYQLSPTPTDTIPLTSIRATIQCISTTRLRLISTEPDPPSPNTLPHPTTVPDYPIPLPLLPLSHDIQSFIGDLPPVTRWPVQHLHFTSPHTLLPYSLRDGTVKAVCDGSWKSPLGTAAFLLGDLRHPDTVLARGVHQTPPAHPRRILGSSYRSELGGILGIVTFIHSLHQIYGFPQGRVHIACDSQSALNRALGPHPIQPQQPDHDLLSMIHDLRSDIPHIRFIPRHVYGHQDTATPYEQLDHWSQWNVQADALAKTFLSYVSAHPQAQPRVHTDRWQLWSNAQSSWSTFSTPLFHHHCCQAALQSTWLKYRSLPPNAAPDIDWNGIESAMTLLSPLRRRWIVKHNSEQCGVGKTLLRWQKAETSQCPRCAHPTETTSHVMRCQGLRSPEIWRRSLQKLAHALRRQFTDPEIISAILNGLRSWHTGVIPVCHSRNPTLRSAFTAQKNLGWENCARGFISHHWQATQALYRKRLLAHDHYSSERWVATLIKGLWDVAWDQWEYRNAILHSPLHRAHGMLTHSLDTAITLEHGKGSGDLPPTYSDLFQISLSSLLQKSIRYRQHWLHNVEVARSQALSSVEPSASSGYHPERSNLRRWLTTGRISL